ncbi:MAG: hypothetical protein MJ016_07940 [Victivallaceae bacterium]|nr:hypothetical protein [Victivallaceae bacterium]
MFGAQIAMTDDVWSDDDLADVPFQSGDGNLTQREQVKAENIGYPDVTSPWVKRPKRRRHR